MIQIEIFEGIENIVTLNQSHSKRFHCTYLLHYFPFDTQVKEALRKNKNHKVIYLNLWFFPKKINDNNLFIHMQFCFCFVKVCYVDFQLKKFDQENVKLEPSAIEMLSPIELTQYYIKVKSFSNMYNLYRDLGDHFCFISELESQPKHCSWGWACGALLWSQDGDCVQEKSHQWATDNLSPLLPPAADNLRNNILQAVLFRGCCDCQSYCHACNHKSLHQVSM